MIYSININITTLYMLLKENQEEAAPKSKPNNLLWLYKKPISKLIKNIYCIEPGKDGKGEEKAAPKRKGGVSAVREELNTESNQ